MPTIIDALVVTLGLDPSAYRKGSREARDDFKRTREEAGSTAKEIEAYGKRAATFFGGLRSEVVGLFLAFAGANGLKDFVQQVLTGEAATGRLATNIGLSTNTLSAWQEAVKTVGGDAKDADAALRGMSDAFQSWQQTGQTAHDAQFLALLGPQYRSTIAKGPEETLLALAKASETMDRRRFSNLAGQLGLSDNTINLLEKGRAGVEQLVTWEKQHGATTDAEAASAQRLQASLAMLRSEMTGNLRPAIQSIVDWLNRALSATGSITHAFAELGREFGGIAGKVAMAMKEWGDFKRGDWNALQADIRQDMANTFNRQFGDKRPAGDSGQDKLGYNPFGAIGTLGGMVGGGGGPVMAHGGRAVALDGNNPGGINDGRFARSQPGYVGANGRYAAFDTLAHGVAAQKALLASYVARGYNTPNKIASRWAPSGDGGNNSGAYAANIARQMGIGVNDTIGANQIAAFQNAQAIQENARYGRMARAGRPAGGRTGSGSSTSSTSIGTINVYTAATDANGIARDLGGAIKKRAMVTQANSGLSG